MWLQQFAKEHGAEYSEDAIGNCKLTKLSPTGPTDVWVCTQGHIDMVTEKNKDKVHDFDNDPITLERVFKNENELWIKASGTTLGADNGIGVCIGLSLISHPPSGYTLPNLEVLCTIDEEAGMTGALNIDRDFLRSRILLNLDSEEDGTFTVGCAGGQDTVATFDVETVSSTLAATHGDAALNVKVSLGGLTGGHSGVQIHEPRANAMKLLADLIKGVFLAHEKKTGAQLIELRGLRGGSKMNAIPRESEVDLVVANEQALNELKQLTEQWIAVSHGQWKYDKVKISFDVEAEKPSASTQVWSSAFATRFVNTLLGMPHGIISMEPDIAHVVQSSTNLALVSGTDQPNEILIGTSQRSSNNSSIPTVAAFVKGVMELAGAKKIHSTSPYPAWAPNVNSPTLKIASGVYERLYKEKPKIEIIHAGLECGVLGERINGLDMISYGPTITGAHSPDEACCVKDVAKSYELTLHILNELATRGQ